PEVVDAIVGALERVGAPLLDPALCREIAARCAEAHAARPLFERWRASVPREAVIAAAIEGPPTLRALALESLVAPREAHRIAVATVAIPPPPAPEGAELTVALGHAPGFVAGVGPGIDRAEPMAPELDPATVERLLLSAVAILAEPRALSTTEAAHAALWQLAGAEVAAALRHTDAIADPAQRFWASSALHHRDRDGYDRYRRRREAALAAVLAVPLLVLLAYPPARPSAAALLGGVAIWGATTFLASGALALPPWPYPLSKVRFLAPAAAAVASAAAVSLTRYRVLAAGAFAGPLCLAAWWMTRSVGFYPPDTQSGYAFIFEPIGGLVVAPVLAVVLSAIAGAVSSRPKGVPR
ncbi:MAG: hypothetical protein ACREQ9_15505, partial [Candidatus Binatia bacterium]